MIPSALLEKIQEQKALMSLARAGKATAEQIAKVTYLTFEIIDAVGSDADPEEFVRPKELCALQERYPDAVRAGRNQYLADVA